MRAVRIGIVGVTAAVAAVAFAESKSSAFVAVMDPEQAFAPVAADANGGAASAIVDCPDVFEAVLTDDFAVDGDVGKAVWKKAKPVGDLRTRDGDHGPMKVKSEIRLLYSANALYVGATFWQPMDRMLARYDQHDMPVYSDDCLEMFLFVPREKGPDMYQWAFNPIGAYLDMKGDNKNYWTKGIQVKTRRFDDRWTLEVKMPFEGIPVERPFAGDFLGLRFCRSVNQPRTTGAVPYLRKAGNNQRANFGKLLFAEPKGGLTKAQADEIAHARAEREGERLRTRFNEVRNLVAAQESAIGFWRDSEHPAVEKARAGVAQMHRAAAAFKKKYGDAVKAGRPVDEKEMKAFFELAAGFRKFVSDNAYLVWQTSPWETGDEKEAPPKKGWGLAPLAFNLAGNEREAVCLVFSGLLCGARHDLRIVPQTYSVNKGRTFVSCDQFEVYEEPYVLQEGSVITAPLVRKDGNIVTLTPGHATRVWIVFNSRGVPAGEYPMSIVLKPATDTKVAARTLRADVKVWNFTLPETRDWPVKSFFWGPNQFCNDESQALRIMHDHHVTHGWTKSFLHQFGLTNHTSIVNYAASTHRKKFAPGELDYDPELVRTGNADFFRTAKELGMRFVFGWGTPENPSWFRLMAERLTGMGFKTEDFVFKSLIRDEFAKKDIQPSAARREAVWADRMKNDWWFQAVYLSVPPPAGATMDDIEEAKLPEFYRMWTVIRGLTKDPKRGPDVIRRLKAKGCSVWTYECSLYMQTKPVLSYFRFYPLEAYTMGLDGAAVWTSGTRQGDDGFDSSDGYDDGALWIGNDRKYVTTKRFEAFREGLEDVAYLDRLKKEIARVKAKGGDVGDTEAYLKEPALLMASPSQDAVDAWRLAMGRAIDALTRR